jgi:predicted kinase
VLGLVGGLPGTGKSTVADALADRVGAVLLSSDRVRNTRVGAENSVTAFDQHFRNQPRRSRSLNPRPA